MIDAQTCLENAERCIILAADAATADAMATLVELAEAWMKVADEAMKSKATSSPLN